MDIIEFSSEPRSGLSGEPIFGELMSSASKQITHALIDASAANADRIDELQIDASTELKGIEATGGWDAYEVWRHFIKDARDRRKSPATN